MAAAFAASPFHSPTARGPNMVAFRFDDGHDAPQRPHFDGTEADEIEPHLLRWLALAGVVLIALLSLWAALVVCYGRYS